MYLYFRYINQNEHFDNLIYLKKQFVVRVGKTCTDTRALYIDMEIKRRGGGIGPNIRYTKLDFDHLKKMQKNLVTII